MQGPGRAVVLGPYSGFAPGDHDSQPLGSLASVAGMHEAFRFDHCVLAVRRLWRTGFACNRGIIEMRVPACCLGVIGEQDSSFFCFAGSGSGAMKFCNDFMSVAIQLKCEQ